jgi:hypothetical protein
MLPASIDIDPRFGTTVDLGSILQSPVSGPNFLN